MCLSKVSATYQQPSELILSGWKEFGGKPSAPTFQRFGDSVLLNTWMDAAKVKAPQNITADDGQTYKAGFHIYAEEDKKGRGTSVLRRVFLRGVTSEGEQSDKKCVIAQEMYVPSNPDDWPPKTAGAPAPASPDPGPKIPPAPKKLIDRIATMRRKP